ncbi:ferritin-like domain-containing protein [Infundibulicybe gibba]|nr:ferritin-like domain-containing protein [Infundibulicybe gibba]
MKAIIAFTTLCAFASTFVSALPAKRNDVIDDTVVLNFALTLEHLEDAFYREGLAKYDERHLPTQASQPKPMGALGIKPPSHVYTTYPKTFVALSQVLEGVGVSAYIGAARFISNKDFLVAGASILATEARHASWIASTVNHFAGWSGDFDVPLGLNEVFSLASPFIKSCPTTNPQLPVKAFPTLTATPVSGKLVPGATITLTFDRSIVKPEQELWVVFLTGLSHVFAKIEGGKVMIPAELRGTVYAVISTSGETTGDGNTIAGAICVVFNGLPPPFPPYVVTRLAVYLLHDGLDSYSRYVLVGLVN